MQTISWMGQVIGPDGISIGIVYVCMIWSLEEDGVFEAMWFVADMILYEAL